MTSHEIMLAGRLKLTHIILDRLKLTHHIILIVQLKLTDNGNNLTNCFKVKGRRLNSNWANSNWSM